ncbi:hypothetical protein HT576_08910 [Haloterrigena sp. SYSU A121-1]|uniref:Phospholipase D-like domain-containing protein n=1 Tax=Haloterrigena gelatinilytica TaxID=2741724 RepID=A0A8J8GL01_9EURY|nr:phospholipase D-like domain-containing protein [Haloterrigena gelatinilytica]NUB91140.1 hypothetical protein [Haloterrigena gelatinilytica]
MARTFSIHSDHIASFLGTAFLNADRVVIVSPWVSDITVQFPETDQLSHRELQLSEAVRSFDVDVWFIVDPEQDDHNRLRRSALLPRVSDVAHIRAVENLHAKAIVTDQVLYQGSANVTYRGLNVNIELCDIRENEHGSAKDFLEERLQIQF